MSPVYTGTGGKNGPAPSGENNLNRNRKTPPQRRRRAIEIRLQGRFQSARDGIRVERNLREFPTTVFKIGCCGRSGEIFGGGDENRSGDHRGRIGT